MFTSGENTKQLATTICLMLACATTAVYWQVSNHQFVNYDDQLFVSDNPHVYTGVALQNTKWAFTTLHGDASYWHPLTWLTHQLDCQFFGLRADAHHLTNLWLHVCNTLLLFLVLRTMTGALWRSALVAALFALHPLHIETVAWISERKSLLCTFFWLLTMAAYTRYTRRPSLPSYACVLVLCCASLMSKPLAVTLPAVLLLLDFWPLRRLHFPWLNDHARAVSSGPSESSAGSPVAMVMLEKLPLFCLAMFVSWLTIKAQSELGALMPLTSAPMHSRVCNAFVSYYEYIRKMILPYDLAVIYPLRSHWWWWQVAGCVLFLACASILVLQHGGRRPYLITGWFWYLGTLFPVIGLLQAGSQGMADRYTYVPLIGLFIILAWGAAEAGEHFPNAKRALAGATACVLVLCGILCAVQLRYWRTAVRLSERAAKVTNRNSAAEHILALAFNGRRNSTEAGYHLEESLRLHPTAEAHRVLGGIRLNEGDSEAAFEHYTAAMKMKPDDAETQAALASFYANSLKPTFHHPAKAEQHAQRACEITANRRRDLLVLRAGILANLKQYRAATEVGRMALRVSVSPREIQESNKLLADIRSKELGK